MNDCPFCRSSELSIEKCIEMHWIDCHQCGAKGPDGRGSTEAIRLWNQPTEDLEGLEYNEKMLRKDCDRLRRELDDALGIIR